MMRSPLDVMCPRCAEPEGVPCLADDNDEGDTWVTDSRVVHMARAVVFILVTAWTWRRRRPTTTDVYRLALAHPEGIRVVDVVEHFGLEDTDAAWVLLDRARREGLLRQDDTRNYTRFIAIFAHCRHCGGDWLADDIAGLQRHEARCDWSVACPFPGCGAEPGERCRYPKGPATSPHGARGKLARSRAEATSTGDDAT